MPRQSKKKELIDTRTDKTTVEYMSLIVRRFTKRHGKSTIGVWMLLADIYGVNFHVVNVKERVRADNISGRDAMRVMDALGCRYVFHEKNPLGQLIPKSATIIEPWAMERALQEWCNPDNPTHPEAIPSWFMSRPVTHLDRVIKRVGGALIIGRVKQKELLSINVFDYLDRIQPKNIKYFHATLPTRY